MFSIVETYYIVFFKKKIFFTFSHAISKQFGGANDDVHIFIGFASGSNALARRNR